MGKPAALIVAKGFDFDARLSAKGEGVADIALVVLPVSALPLPKEIEELKLGDFVAEKAIAALTQSMVASQETKDTSAEEVITVSGKDYPEAQENLEKYFLQHCWSDGFPLVPPTEEAVNRMLEATELAPDHVVGLVEPGGGQATVKKIAVNAVMAGCLPQYLPVVLAAVEAITDPAFDLRSVQCTTGFVSPLLIASGPPLIEKLNINDSYSTMGPGWRANTTIGRAVRLVMVNIGLAWPGKPDMKAFGSPFKYVTLMAENESAYMGAWEPFRVAEGFGAGDFTVSAMPAVSWQPEYYPADMATVDNLVAQIARQGKVKYDRFAGSWGMENLVLLSPAAFDAIRKEGRSRADFQKMLYEAIQLPCSEFFGDEVSRRSASRTNVGPTPIPQWIVDRCNKSPAALVPLFCKPESIKIVVAGATGPAMTTFVATWGWGPVHFVTKPVKLPKNWGSLLDRYPGWETPIVR